QIQELNDYYPYGTVRTNETINTYSEQRKFAGTEYDSDTGLNYMSARYYNSASGQFVSEDPIFLWLGDRNKVSQDQLTMLLTDPQQQNSYSYARNNPIIYTDRTGLGFFTNLKNAVTAVVHQVASTIASAASSAKKVATTPVLPNTPKAGSAEYNQKVAN